MNAGRNGGKNAPRGRRRRVGRERRAAATARRRRIRAPNGSVPRRIRAPADPCPDAAIASRRAGAGRPPRRERSRGRGRSATKTKRPRPSIPRAVIRNARTRKASGGPGAGWTPAEAPASTEHARSGSIGRDPRAPARNGAVPTGIERHPDPSSRETPAPAHPGCRRRAGSRSVRRWVARRGPGRRGRSRPPRRGGRGAGARGRAARRSGVAEEAWPGTEWRGGPRPHSSAKPGYPSEGGADGRAPGPPAG